jgi:[ribosomal protein S5]-alanine N-acetyltransferase
MTALALERVETMRMVCERLEPGHLDEIRVLMCDPRVATTLMPSGKPPSERELIASHAEKIRHWDRHGFGLWLLRDHASGEMLGRGGLQHTWATGRDEIEVGWAIVPERWGQGLATELALASIDAAFGQLDLPEVIAYTLPSNRASRRVMEKTGFGFDREIVASGLPHVLYRLRRARC